MEVVGKLKPFFNGFYARGIENESFLTQSASLAVLAACNAGLAVLMSWYVVTHIGLSAESDAFFASTVIPQFVFILLTVTFLPVLVPLLATRDDDHFREDVWSIFSLTGAVFIVIGLALYLSAGVWVPLFVPGFSPAAKIVTASLVRIQLVSMVLNALIVTLWVAHHARHRFVWVELSGVVANVAGFSFLILTIPRLGIWAAAINSVFYNTLKIAFLLPIVGRRGWPKWRTQIVREAWRCLQPVVPGQVYLRTDTLLDRFLTSMTGPGTLSLLHLAQQIYANIVLLLSKALIAPMAPKLAVYAREGNWNRYRRHYETRLLLLLTITVAGCGFLIMGAPAFRLLAQEAGITQQNLETLWLTMVVLGGTFIGGALVQATAGAFYAMGNTKTPSKVSAAVYTLYLPVKIAVFFKFGLIGLAMAMSSYFLVNCGIQFFMLRRDMRRKQRSC